MTTEAPWPDNDQGQNREIALKQQDIDTLFGLAKSAMTHTWTAGPTPPHLDLASQLPPDRATATLFATAGPVATFWSYMHDGPHNATYVAWMANHATGLLSSEFDESVGDAGLALLSEVAYRDWWPGYTPFYLRGGDGDAITLRTNQHTEEIATLWGARSKDAASLICWFVNAGPDILARAWSRDGARTVIASLLPALQQHYRVRLAPDVEDVVVDLATQDADLQVPVSYAMAVAAQACMNGKRDSLISEADIRAAAGPAD